MLRIAKKLPQTIHIKDIVKAFQRCYSQIADLKNVKNKLFQWEDLSDFKNVKEHNLVMKLPQNPQ